jgi:hypothetical protein
MAEPTIVQLAQDLEWLGCEEEHYGHKHAMEGFPEAGPSWDEFCEKRRGVLTTADKIERELRNAVRFNPARLVGVDYPLGETLDAITELLNAVEDIKQASVFAVHTLPPMVRNFTKMVERYLEVAGTLSR